MSGVCLSTIRLHCKCGVQFFNSTTRCSRICTQLYIKKWQNRKVHPHTTKCLSSFKNVLFDRSEHYLCVKGQDRCVAEEYLMNDNSASLQNCDTKDRKKCSVLDSELNDPELTKSPPIEKTETQLNVNNSSQGTDEGCLLNEYDYPSSTDEIVAPTDNIKSESCDTFSDESSNQLTRTYTDVIYDDKEFVYSDEIIDRQDYSHMTTKKRSVFPPSYNLATYVNQSQTLTNLVKLGVDLSEIEKIEGAGDLFIRLDFDRDVEPYILFLNNIGISDEKLGFVLSKAPFLLKETLPDMQIRLNYLKAKKFNKESIENIVSRAPKFLLMNTTAVDSKLGFYQKEFMLSGDEVRSVVNTRPQLITWEVQKFKDVKFYMKEFLGFSENDLKRIFLSVPKVFVSGKHQLGERFDFLFNTMGIPHSHIVHWPYILRTRLFVLHDRHRFLLSLNRAQYDPQKVNYVPLSELATLKDEDFCKNAAKVPVSCFDEFLLSI